MTSEPDIVSVAPRGPITRPQLPIPVLATLHRSRGDALDVPAAATAWTRDAVEVTWVAAQGGLSSGWIPAADILRGKPAEERIHSIRARTALDRP